MPRWTDEARAKQREVINKVKPWERSTGAKTTEGKVRSARNSFKNGEHSALVRQIRRIRRYAKKNGYLD